jgi:hypothetical protein
MLGVISCPKCKHVCGIYLRQKSKKCARCDYNMNISKVRIWVKTSNHDDLPELIKNVKKEIAEPTLRNQDY